MEEENKKVEENISLENVEAKEEAVEEKKVSNEFLDAKEKDLGRFVPLILTIALIIGGVGFFLTLYTSPKRIVASGIDKVTTEFKNILELGKTDSKVGDDYTIEGSFDIKAESAYINTLATVSSDYVTYSNMLNNLSKTQNKFSLAVDKTNKKQLITVDSILNNEELISVKHLIENSTEYYFIKGFLNTYVNNGTNDYFEALDNEADTYENAIYIYDLAIKSFKENLKDEYFTKSSEEVTINDKQQKLVKSSLVINNKVAREIAVEVLKDLKEDKKANEILTAYDKDFKDRKIKKNVTMFDDGEELDINVYSDSLTYKAKLYEFVMKDSEDTYAIKYYEEKDNTRLEVINNKETLSVLNVTKEGSTKTNIEILDGENNKIGEGTITNTDTNQNMLLSITSEETTIDFSMNFTTKEEKANKEYSTEGSMSFKAVSSGMEIVNLTLGINATIKDEVNINEDVSNSVLASSVTEDQQTTLTNKLGEIFLKLMS